MTVETDRIVHWLLDSVELQTNVFHVGQYCGRWRASTSGRALGSFHLVLRGDCFLHLKGKPPIPLRAREGVLLLRDIPHFLCAERDPDTWLDELPMQALSAELEGGTGLACGFFQFGGELSSLIVESFPEYLIIRAEDPSFQAAGKIGR